MRFLAYMVGLILVIAGVAWAAIEAGAPMLYVQIGAVILLGAGLIGAAGRARYSRGGSDVTVVHDNDLM